MQKASPKLAAAKPRDAVFDASAEAAVGQRIRAIRKEQSLSLVEVAARTGFSIGYLSQVERGLSSPSLRAMVALGEVFGIGLAGLFERGASGTAGGVVMRRADRKHLDFWRTGIDKEILTLPDPTFVLNLYVMTLEPGGSSGREFLTHVGEEAGLVLEGRFELEVEGEVWDLAEGDSFRFASRRGHRYRNPGTTETARVLWSIYTPKPEPTSTAPA